MNLTRESPEVLASKNEVLQALSSDHWLLKADKKGDRRNGFLMDVPRSPMIEINGKPFAGSIEAKKISADYTEEQALKEFVRRTLLYHLVASDFEARYAQLTQHWNQSVFSLPLDAVMSSAMNPQAENPQLTNRGITLLKGTPAVSIYLEGEQLYVDTTVKNLQVEYDYHYADRSKNNEKGTLDIPGTLTSRAVLTPAGFQLESITPSNALLRDLCLKKGVDVKAYVEKTQNKLDLVASTCAEYQRYIKDEVIAQLEVESPYLATFAKMDIAILDGTRTVSGLDLLTHRVTIPDNELNRALDNVIQRIKKDEPDTVIDEAALKKSWLQEINSFSHLNIEDAKARVSLPAWDAIKKYQAIVGLQRSLTAYDNPLKNMENFKQKLEGYRGVLITRRGVPIAKLAKVAGTFFSGGMLFNPEGKKLTKKIDRILMGEVQQVAPVKENDKALLPRPGHK